jgi:uncharacterized protein YceH (UPF0502 family)
MLDVSPVEIRILGSLVEKQRTTPDAYPLTLNALRAACNQSTSRDPVVSYDDTMLREALERLGRRGWTRLASGPHSRSPKYRHLLEEALGLDVAEQSVLAVLMLRGPQTPGELKQRTERLEGFADPGAVQEVIERLIGRGFVIRHPRRLGQKEDRFEQVLGGDDAVELDLPEPPEPEGGAPVSDGLVEEETARLDRLEADLLDLKGEIARLREALGD